MAGGIAQAFYGGVPEEIARQAYLTLVDSLAGVTRRFTEAYGCR